jgi:ketosteroid isomerase-like protein
MPALRFERLSPADLDYFHDRAPQKAGWQYTSYFDELSGTDLAPFFYFPLILHAIVPELFWGENMTRTANICLAVLIVASVAAGQTGGKKTSADEQRIRDLDKAWSQAAASKDVDKTVSYYTDGASVMPFNAPIATGKDQIRHAWSELMANPGFALTFTPTRIEVAKSRDLAYEVGTFEWKMNDAQNNPTTSSGKYVVAWKRQPKGEWKVDLDIFNTDK